MTTNHNSLQHSLEQIQALESLACAFTNPQ
uniref:Uncharacterized protein n=1 Tax=Arundo donax TaxID=35708 RepID=A0A0A8YQ10_ARUDO